MKNETDPILPYAPPPKSPLRRLRLTRRTSIGLAISCLILLVLYGFLNGPTSGQIRLDTGDLRYCWYGIPLDYKPMPEPGRSRLLTLAAKSPPIPARWVTCVTYPLPSSNNSDLMCRGFYWSISIWADEDPHIARWALEDTAKYLQDTNATSGLPESEPVVSIFVVDRGAKKLDPAWRDMDDIKDYCTRHGYTPSPPTGSPTR